MDDKRTQIAALAMQGLLAHGPTGEPADVYAEDAVTFADALLKRLAATAPDAEGDAFAGAAQDAGRYGMGTIRLGAAGPEHVPAEAVRPDAGGVELSEAVMGAIDRALGHAGGLADYAQRSAIARAAIAADRAERPVALPPGWVAVPREMTEEIVEALEQAHWSDNHRDVWESLLAAAPPPSIDPVPLVLPPGWVAMLREPTGKMLSAGLRAGMTGIRPVKEEYRAVLAAAPSLHGVKEGEINE